jgi:ring-1,2-phenylacetyl-CoA epoxidase subunit PaaD
MQTTSISAEQQLADARKLLDNVFDPEIPVLTIDDLGIIRAVKWAEDGALEVVITPTYSGCPAMAMIEVNIRAALQEGGFDRVKVTTVLSPPWTTDWLSHSGRVKLEAYGIAAPATATMDKSALSGARKALHCPRCQSTNTAMISQFGSTACKALFRCLDCLEPFDYFKCH